MPCQVMVRDGDSIEKALKIFKKQVEKAGILGELRKREFYDKPSVKRKKKKKAAQKRAKKKDRTKRGGRFSGNFA